MPGELPPALATRLARLKAEAIAQRHPQAVVIGSDQVATLDGAFPIGKPGTIERARAQLSSASGRTMRFHSAFAIIAPGGNTFDDRVDVSVKFRRLSAASIERYLALEPALDCAGAAKCEGLGITLLETIKTADPTALIGLPLIRLSSALRRLGLDPLT